MADQASEGRVGHVGDQNDSVATSMAQQDGEPPPAFTEEQLSDMLAAVDGAEREIRPLEDSNGPDDVAASLADFVGGGIENPSQSPEPLTPENFEIRDEENDREVEEYDAPDFPELDVSAAVLGSQDDFAPQSSSSLTGAESSAHTQASRDQRHDALMFNDVSQSEGPQSTVNHQATISRQAAILEEIKRKTQRTKKRPAPVSLDEANDYAMRQVELMNSLAEQDYKAIADGRPALAKVKHAKDLLALIEKTQWTEYFLSNGVISALSRWLEIHRDLLPAGPIRHDILRLLLRLPISQEHLENSCPKIGETILSLFQHRDETVENRMCIEKLVRKWARMVFPTSLGMAAREDADLLPSRNEAGRGASQQSAGAFHEMDHAIRSHAQSQSRHAVIPYKESLKYTQVPASDDVRGCVAQPSKELRLRRKLDEARKGSSRR